MTLFVVLFILFFLIFFVGFGAVKFDLKTKTKNGVVSRLCVYDYLALVLNNLSVELKKGFFH